MNKIIAVFFFLLLISCTRNGSTPDHEGDPYLVNLKKSLTEMPVNVKIHPGSSSIYQAAWLLTPANCDQIIVSDNADQTISLLNSRGDVLSKVGGEGRGPGEFQSILGPHIGADNRLYVIDGLSFRISIFDVGNEGLNFVTSVPYKNPDNYFLNILYVTEFGNFGVYQDSEGYFTPDNRFLLYRLDENFNPSERLLEMPGNERVKDEAYDLTFYLPYNYLSRTIWDIDHEWFYYITTLDSSVHRYNLRTGKQEELTFFQLDERLNSRKFTQSVKDHYPVEDEEYWSALGDIRTLPLFSGLHVEDSRIFRSVMPVPGEDGLILYANQDSKEVNYFKTPQEFAPKATCGNTLYGVDYRVDGDYRVMILDML